MLFLLCQCGYAHIANPCLSVKRMLDQKELHDFLHLDINKGPIVFIDRTNVFSNCDSGYYIDRKFLVRKALLMPKPPLPLYIIIESLRRISNSKVGMIISYPYEGLHGVIVFDNDYNIESIRLVER